MVNDLQTFIIDKTNIASCLECDCRNAYIEMEGVALDLGVYWLRWCGVPEWYVKGFYGKSNLKMPESVSLATEENTIHPIIAIQTMLQRLGEVIMLLEDVYASVILESYELQL